MKKRIGAFSLVLCVLLCLAPTYADGLWSEDYYRAYDTSGQLTEAERNRLDEDCIAFMKRYQTDLALLAVTTEDFTIEQAEDYYIDCNFGYGGNRDGFLWVYNLDNNRAELFRFGAAEGMALRDTIDFAGDAAQALRERRGVYGCLYEGLSRLSSDLKDTVAEQEPGVGIPRGIEGSRLPSWYPANTENFSYYHDDSAPRVVDGADIFTDAEEQAMEVRLTEIRGELLRDILVYTDVTDYGLGKEVCAADFYDFNGYGYGNEREGVCLFIDMDPNDRGWWVCCTGSETMGLYTEDAANLIDDALYQYMSADDYGAGVADWIENIRTLYVKGTPFAPDWYPAKGESLTLHHDDSAPRVVDELGLLSGEERESLTAQAAEIARKHGIDVAIHTAPYPEGLSYAEVARQYYTYMGYGYGDNYDGILLTVYKSPGYYAATRITAVGSAAGQLSETNEQRLRDLCEAKTHEYQYYEGMSQWLDQVDHMARTGRVPRSTLYWALISLLSLLLGSVFGGISLGIAKAKMAPPKEKRDADAYFDPSSSRVRDAGRQFLYTSTSRRYDPPKEKSSGGGSRSSGRSSYRSSYSGSSGSRHSGSGRRF